MIGSLGVAEKGRRLSFAYKTLTVAVIAIQMLAVLCLGDIADYDNMAAISITQLVFLIVLLLLAPARQSFFILFLVANWVFHCGQLVCIAVGYNEVLNLDFRMYGDVSTARSAFLFYLFSQSLVVVGGVVGNGAAGDKRESVLGRLIDFDMRVALSLFFVGLPFRLYIDVSKVLASQSSGYEGVYSLIIPAPVQAVAFFCEVGALMLLWLLGKRKERSFLFWAMCFEKVVVMSSGGRQDSFCFLVIWFLAYFCYLRRLTASRLLSFGVAAVAVVILIDAFGEMRTEGFSFDSLDAYFSTFSFADVLWDSLGEFGCAFTTLVVTIRCVPGLLSFGLGSSYVAGVLSVIPGLVGQFPGLKAATLYVTSMPGTAFFGGSMLGEFFYNFGWWGLLGALVVGVLCAYCQRGFNGFRANGDSGTWFASVLAVFLLLFVRGYFTDAVMKLVYTLVFAWIATGIFRRIDARKGDRGRIEQR